MDTASLARKIVRESQLSDEVDPRETLSPFDRGIVGTRSIRINVPLYSVADLRQHISMLEDAAHHIGVMLDRSKEPDRSKIFLVRGRLRELNQEINAYRWPAKG